jgi:beta-galactosidase
MQRTLGTCYYPEHWSEEIWTEDAARMAETGLTWVRIGEFAWSRLEAVPGALTWDWLDRAIETLGGAGLQVVLGTPTATPPRWMLDRHPDMLAVDAAGRPRGFGSRRHYDFSHAGYREEARRIARLMAERYGRNPHVRAWQTDNEYGCHGTTLSFSEAARRGFRDWLAQKYQSPDALNRAWGNVFWSMEYAGFDEIDLPNLTVTEANPAHSLDFRRYASAQVTLFNRAQVEEIRKHSDRPILHNYMGRETSFDHWQVGRDLDGASWDSYPLGFLSDRLENAPERKARFLRQGDPDNQAFHHDLYRGVGGMGAGRYTPGGRFWIMEQQPGPVNWAPWNPAPLPGMARLWAWEAFAHGAEAVLYFRWRQAPFAQEQMHAGLLRPDSTPAPALAEARQVADEIAQMPQAGCAPGDVALIFDYESCWAWDIQPQGADFDGFRLAMSAYRACRRAGLNIDILPPDIADLSSWPVVLAPGLMTLPDSLRKALDSYHGRALIGPRTDVKTPDFAIPVPLGPRVGGVTSVLTESLPPDAAEPLEAGGAFRHWREWLEGEARVFERTTDGRPAIMGGHHLRYLAGWPDDDAFYRIVSDLAREAGLHPLDLPDGLRLRDTATHRFLLNYTSEPVTWNGVTLPAAGVHWTPH